jgi:hypothetical protein
MRRRGEVGRLERRGVVPYNTWIGPGELTGDRREEAVVAWRPSTQAEVAIINALRRTPAFFLSDLLPPRHTPEEVAELNRVAYELTRAGKIAMVTWFSDAELAAGLTVTVYRAGDREPQPGQVVRLKRDIR